MCKVLSLIGHPSCGVNVAVQCSFDRGNHLQHPLFVFWWKIFGDIGLADGMAKIVVSVERTTAPTRLNFFRARQNLSVKFELLVNEGLAQRARHGVNR